MVDVDRGMLTVRVGKGDKDRCTVLPKSLRKEIAEQIERAREVWKIDRDEQLPGVYMPGALARKFRKAAETFEWFWLFPARHIIYCSDNISSIMRYPIIHSGILKTDLSL